MAVTSLLALSLASSGCSHDVYSPQPFQALRLEEDVRAKVSFNIPGADGTPVKVESVQTLRAGGYYKLLTPEQLAAATRPSK